MALFCVSICTYRGGIFNQKIGLWPRHLDWIYLRRVRGFLKIKPEINEDPYETHAVFALEFRCKVCGKRMLDDDIVREKFTDAWFKELGAKAAKEGWKVLNEWESVGPECLKVGEAAAKPSA